MSAAAVERLREAVVEPGSKLDVDALSDPELHDAVMALQQCVRPGLGAVFRAGLLGRWDRHGVWAGDLVPFRRLALAGRPVCSSTSAHSSALAHRPGNDDVHHLTPVDAMSLDQLDSFDAPTQPWRDATTTASRWWRCSEAAVEADARARLVARPVVQRCCFGDVVQPHVRTDQRYRSIAPQSTRASSG